MRLCLLPLLFALCLSAPACAPKTIQDPAVRAAYTADQLVLRLGELQNATIDAATTQKIDLPTSRKIVTWISGDLRSTPPTTGVVDVIKTAPQGWKSTVQSGWATLKPTIDKVPVLAIYSSVIDALIGGL